jgi:crossover junction endodeoxyribonuclease RuvC
MKKNNEKRIILGLDPGTQFVGFAALAVEKNEFIVLGHGVLIPDHPASNASLRILELGQSFKEILKKYKPQDVVIEKSFFHKNADTAFKLGQSRGVYIYESMLFGATVAEYANGGADKMMVDQALRNLLPISGFNSYDASDAMALAYHHALELKKAALFSQSVRI